MELWKSNLQKNNIDMFPLLKVCATVNIEENKYLFVEHLNTLLIQFSSYFRDIDLTKFAWVQNLFIEEKDVEFELTIIEREN